LKNPPSVFVRHRSSSEDMKLTIRDSGSHEVMPAVKAVMISTFLQSFWRKSESQRLRIPPEADKLVLNDKSISHGILTTSVSFCHSEFNSESKKCLNYSNNRLKKLSFRIPALAG
jgi:hypothetical protein